jgi:hypothetical protein
MPIPVRTGALRGRSSRLCSVVSPVIQDSMNGYRASPVNRMPGRIMAGTMMFHEMVQPKITVSQLGMMRSAPSRKPMYQSGCEPAET